MSNFNLKTFFFDFSVDEQNSRTLFSLALVARSTSKGSRQRDTNEGSRTSSGNKYISIFSTFWNGYISQGEFDVIKLVSLKQIFLFD